MQAQQADYLLKQIDSAFNSVARRQSFIQKYKMLMQYGSLKDGAYVGLARELKELVARSTDGHIQ